MFDARGCTSLVEGGSSRATTRVRQYHSTSIRPCESLLNLASPLLWSGLGSQMRDTGRRRCATDRLAGSAGTTLVTHENILICHEEYGCLLPNKADDKGSLPFEYNDRLDSELVSVSAGSYRRTVAPF